MAMVKLDDSTLHSIADKIREKNKEVASYKPSEMPNAIDRIVVTETVIEPLEVTANGEYTVPAGVHGYNPINVNVPANVKSIDITANGTYTATDCDGYDVVNVAVDGIPTDEELTLTGDCDYRFAANGWVWFINKYGNRITTNNINNSRAMFSSSFDLTEIPFQLNFKLNGSFDMDYMFYKCQKLTSIPDITVNPSNYFNMGQMFQGCNRIETLPYIYNAYPSKINLLFSECSSLRNIPEDYVDTWNFSYLHRSSANAYSLFKSCYSLRKVPTNLLKNMWTSYTSPYGSCFFNTFQFCYSLDELVGLPVPNVNYTNNVFMDTFTNCTRLKRLTFALNPETNAPYTAKWKNQVIDLTNHTGSYGTGSLGTQSSFDNCPIFNYNSGITQDKAIYDDATYQALKNDPDATPMHNTNYKNKPYSRYNHDSAVETINSLPDTSAYLASAGGTNTIKFVGLDGELTDGGAISTLTAEEIAVATAKGWTVTLI